MAVQAQYPSNVLLFNSNGQQQAKNMLGITGYPVLQPPYQPGSGGVGREGRGGGGFLLDQSHFLPPNNGAGDVKNPRKRGREEATTTTTTTTTTSAANNNNNISNPFNLSLLNQHQNQNPNPHHPQQYSNHHPHQLIELSQLQHQPNAVVSTGLKLSFGDQQQQQNQQQQTHNSPVLISLFSDDLANHIRLQSEELNHFIHAQAEQLRRSIAEKRQRHYRTLLVAAEEAVARRLREKEVDLDKAARRHADLEARAAQLGAESQAWQAKARAQEAQAALLQAQLQQALLTAATGGVVGAASKPPADRDEGCDAAKDAESAYNDPERVVETAPFMKWSRGTTNEPACRACRLRAATVVILPCRHLSVCVDCDGVVQACPVCLGLRNSSVEVYLT